MANAGGFRAPPVGANLVEHPLSPSAVTRPTDIELPPPAQIFSLSPPGTSGERGTSLRAATSNRKQDGPPLPGPLLPRREERENAIIRSQGSSFLATLIVAPKVI